MSKCQTNVSPKWYPCRGDQSCAAETTKMPPTYPKYFADASKIFCRRVQGFRRRVQNISPTRPKYFADASKDFADASRDFTADVVTLPTRPVTVTTMQGIEKKGHDQYNSFVTDRLVERTSPATVQQTIQKDTIQSYTDDNIPQERLCTIFQAVHRVPDTRRRLGQFLQS